jgi:hypothetical protein
VPILIQKLNLWKIVVWKESAADLVVNEFAPMLRNDAIIMTLEQNLRKMDAVIELSGTWGNFIEAKLIQCFEADCPLE